MVDKVYDFMKEMRFRLSSPFFSSFIISWLVINWRVPVGLLFYKQSDLTADGYDSYFDLIEKNFHLGTSIIVPLISASVYSFGYPWLRNKIMNANTYFNTKGIEKNLKISKDGKVPFTMLLDMAKKYKEAVQAIETNIENEAENKERYDKLLIDYQKLMTDSNDVANERNIWEQTNDPIFLLGSWSLRIASLEKTYDISITRENFIYRHDAPFDYTKNSVIIHFSNNVKRNDLYIFLSTTTLKGDRVYYYFRLGYNDNGDYYTGFINNEIPCELKKISPAVLL